MSIMNKAMYAVGGMEFTVETRVRGDFDEVVEFVIETLEDEGMGIQADLDPGNGIQQNIDEEFPNYRILGACALEYAYEALSTDKRMGAMMPCNMVVYEDDETDEIVVRGVDTQRVLPVTGNSELQHLADEISEVFETVLDRVDEEFESVE
ncbi:MAG: DUF302 domain-containing protein [Halobacteria archaeon]|nr:DUF302 domain-containing protein [Halobacteria archaeon]